MFNKLLFIASLILFFKNICYCQTKTYSGKYEGGTASYQYYENEKFDRIFNGNFSFKSDKIDIDGKYQNNKKVGEWVYFGKAKKVKHLLGDFWTLYNINIRGKYKEGMLDGKWTYIYSEKGGGNDQKVYSEATFNENIFVGNFILKRGDPDDISYTTVIKGQFDKNGFLNGTWVNTFESTLFSYKKRVDSEKYYKGVAYWKLDRDPTTGEIYKFFDSTAFVKTFWENYDSVDGKSDLRGICYYPDTVESTQYVLVWQQQSDRGDSYNPLYYFNKSILLPPKCYEIKITKCPEGTITKKQEEEKRIKDSIKQKDEELAELARQQEEKIRQDNERIRLEKELKEKEKARLEIERQEQEKLSIFLAERKITKYNIQDLNPKLLDSIKNAITKIIDDAIYDMSYSDGTIIGNIHIGIDTLGQTNHEINISLENKDILNKIIKNLNDFKISTQYINGYTVNIQPVIIDYDINFEEGIMNFKIINGICNFNNIKKNKEVKTAIAEKYGVAEKYGIGFSNKKDGDYKVKYLLKNGIYDFRVISNNPK